MGDAMHDTGHHKPAKTKAPCCTTERVAAFYALYAESMGRAAVPKGAFSFGPKC